MISQRGSSFSVTRQRPASKEIARVEIYWITWAARRTRDLLQVGEGGIAGEKVQPPLAINVLLRIGLEAIAGFGQKTPEQIAALDGDASAIQASLHRHPLILRRRQWGTQPRHPHGAEVGEASPVSGEGFRGHASI